MNALLISFYIERFMKTHFVFPLFGFVGLLVLFSASNLLLPRAVDAQKGQTSSGTDFWLGFMPNSFSQTCCPPQGMEIFIGSGTANVVSVDAYGGNQLPTYQQRLMSANSIWTLSSAEPSPWETDSNEHPAFWAIHVYAKNPVVVYGYQYTGANTSSADGYLALPTPALGTEYYPSCYYDDHYTLGPSNPLAGQFLIISPFDNDTVTIGPVKTPTRVESYPQDTGNILNQRGDTWEVILQKGQTYLVQSTGKNYGDDDITGTHIVSTKPIAVLSGHQLCSIPIGELADVNGSKDEIMEMVPPLDKWGSEYYDMPTATRTVCGDLVRVIAGEDGEVITATSLNGSSSASLAKAGDFYDFDLVTNPTDFRSQRGKKFLAVQMAYSQGYDGDPGLSDPFSTVLPAKQRFQKKMFFNVPDRVGVPGFVHYATFLCQTDSIKAIQINGKPIGSYTFAGSATIPGTTPSMSSYRIQLPGDATTYLATCGAPFGCTLYGWSSFESYGQPAGLALNINSDDTRPPLESLEYTCGKYQVHLADNRKPPQYSFTDSKIADLAMITDTFDARWPVPSNNFAFSFDSTHPFTTGDSIAFFNLTVLDPGRDAYAAVWTSDRAGNDTVYEFSYLAPALEPPNGTSIDFGSLPIGKDSCLSIVWSNRSNGALTISSASLVGTDTSVFPGLSNLAPITLTPGTSFNQTMCLTSSDTLGVFDTLLITVGCAELRYPLHISGTTPIIIASDVDFGDVPVGDTACKPVEIRNVGNAPLVLTANWLLPITPDFSFPDSAQFPDTIPPGGSITLDVCFHPQSAGPVQTRIDWGTNLAGAYIHQRKDTSSLFGNGTSAGVTSTPQRVPISLIVSPNPVSGVATISLTGAPLANVEIFDILGREVANFRVMGSYEWQVNTLPAGTYSVRAKAAGAIASRRVVKQ